MVMKCLVTGAAGFIGSHLCEELLQRGHDVVGIDSFIPYYPKAIKQQNLAKASANSRFQFHSLDLRHDNLEFAIGGSEVVFHLAAMPGLIKSWTDFDLYNSCNVQGTQRLLEGIYKVAPKLRRFVYASTSSVYGKYSTGDESMPTRPTSPEGVTKLAGEHLCRAYAENHGIPVVVARYFSVYGPRQRPDMGYYQFIKALQNKGIITVFGDGQQVRGNTYVSDCVAATIAVAEAPIGETYNLGGGESASVWDILHKLEAIAGKKVQVKQDSPRPGDQRQTFADTTKLRQHFGWQAKIGLDEGLKRQWDWQRDVPT
jgi:nucleoside-diphosphate-sugar epimerase